MKKTFIIAEAGVNHNGDLTLAKRLIDVAADAGANAVKFQTFSADALVTKTAPKAAYQICNANTTESQYDMLKKLELSREKHFFLKQYCDEKKITFFSTPFDLDSANFLLQDMKLSTIKIASGEITNALLLLKIARAQPKIILSTGMATLGEIEEALSIIAFGLVDAALPPSKKAFFSAFSSELGQQMLREKVTLLHCTSNYPAQFQDIHLRAMDTLSFAFGLPVGYSDHSLGIAVSIAAVARGACVIEKHFTLDKNLPGPDHQASLDPVELKNMIYAIREIEVALGNTTKAPTGAECETKNVARKSLIAANTILPGEKFTAQTITVKRPGMGISAIHYWDYLDKKASRKYEAGDLIYE
ncbi:MAG: N-acetylneuraminate synthase [Coxiellaceae bacterium]|nr:N-acetylneuraminate synthase [Coxiellaceae bacterium]